MKIIGHRGAAGLAPENTLAAIKAGLKAKADYIEFDVRVTEDNEIVLCHDPTLLRTFGIDRAIADVTLSEIRETCPKLPTLFEALQTCGTTDVIVDLKVPVDPDKLMNTFQQFTHLQIRVATTHPSAIMAIKAKYPDQICYLLEHWKLRWALKNIRSTNADGLGMHYGAMNPIVYLIARRRHLQIYIYTLNVAWIAKLYSRLYPKIFICTDIPRLI